MQEVVELSDERIDFENRVEVLKTVEFTVDANGKPILNNKIATGKSNVRGFSVISAFNLTNPNTYPIQQPFISYTILSSGFVQVNNIRGLQANNKYRLTLIVY
jgi:hypothetical protein